MIPFPWSLLAGVCAALAAANELPALSMTVFWFLLFAWMSRASVIPFAVGVGLVAVAFFGTNWIAHQSLRPPYMHRGTGPLIAELTSNAEQPDEPLLGEVQASLDAAGLSAESDQSEIDPSDESGRWVVRRGERQYALLREADGSWKLNHWDDWYEYPGTYWKDGNRRGVDRGEASRLVYFLHLTVGHHGLFSLTPIWLLMPVGLVMGLFLPPPDIRRLMAAILIATLVCFLFYLSRPLIDRNYGGVSVCFRWLLWFAPLWLLATSLVIDRMEAGRWQRMGMVALLAMSVFSVSASLQTPWQSPWLYQFWQFLGWISA